MTDLTTGGSVYEPPEIFTSPEVLAAADALRHATDDSSAAETVDHVVTALLPCGSGLPPEQAAAVRSVCTSGRVCEVLVGPAGTGKTTTMAGLSDAWEAQHGPGSLIGLAASAVAAQVLGTEISIAAEDTAQRLAQQKAQPSRAARIQQLQARHDELAAVGRPTDRIDRTLAHSITKHDRCSLHPGQLLVLDEASLADLTTLNAPAAQAKTAGAKLLLVGDHHQLPGHRRGLHLRAPRRASVDAARTRPHMQQRPTRGNPR